ncbi:MAG: DUF1127 domain-containing protein [Proteobacteria bacterium]|nr:DUF1127 domain-containing protein [Pseudomonadota bacterium]
MDHAKALTLRHERPRIGVLAWLRLALTLKRHRRALGGLDRHLLKDIGLSETEARLEAERPVWDVPSHWLR